MDSMAEEVSHFARQRVCEEKEARQNAAFFLTSGIDLATALSQEGDQRKVTIIRLGRLLERERLKGIRQHWSYDLNRHIALKQAYDRLLKVENVKNGQNRMEKKIYTPRCAAKTPLAICTR